MIFVLLNVLPTLMPKYKFLYILLLFSPLLHACNDLVTLASKGTPKPVKVCMLKNANHGHGIVYNLDYNTQKLPTSLAGFADFDRITYENTLPVKAENSRDKSYYITFDYDAIGSISHINFIRTDNEGKTFAYKSNVFVNANKQVERIDLSLPNFTGILEASISYDKNKNITKISILKDGQQRTILENLSFDDKNAPYVGTSLANIMAYFVVFSASVGTENTTYFINKNNVTAARIYSIGGDIDITYQYEYNDGKYPTKTNITRKQNGKEDKYQESFSYVCE